MKVLLLRKKGDNLFTMENKVERKTRVMKGRILLVMELDLEELLRSVPFRSALFC